MNRSARRRLALLALLVALLLPARTRSQATNQNAVATDALGRAVTSGQYGDGARWVATPDGRYTVQQVDGLGRPITTTQNYSPTAPPSATDANLITATVYDAAGRVTQLTDPAGV